MATNIIATTLATGTSDAAVVTKPTGRNIGIRGWHVRETVGTAAAQVYLRDTNVSGAIVGGSSVAANGAETVWFTDPVFVAGDVFADRNGTGSISVTVYWQEQ